ncbi:MAG: hypothetical protein QOE70_4006 [Chthoniobacter sp.]|jgi:hypothetical protein|nr:hypothetical protein [Chthoniobacter sp.]
MSHVTSIDINITDLSALRATFEELGGIWHEGQRNYKWYGQVMGDYPLPNGFKAADLGKCEHAISLPGCEYEIGVLRKKDGSGGYTLLFDFWGYTRSGGERVGGEMLQEQFGKGLCKVKQFYGVNKATMIARAKGYSVQRKKLPSGSIKLVVSGF